MNIGKAWLDYCRNHDMSYKMIRGCAAEGNPDETYLERYHLVKIQKPRWMRAGNEEADTLFGIYLHCFHKSDTDRALHSHPWSYMTLILSHGYWENTARGRFWRKPGTVRFAGPNHEHWVELDKDADGKTISAITLFFVGPRTREWGFRLPQGWTPWREAFKLWKCNAE
jgi:hypothetical protein